MVGSSSSTSSLMSLQQSRILTPYYARKGTATSSNCNFKLHFVSVNKKRKKKQESFFGSHGGAVAIARKNKNNVAWIFPSEASYKRRNVIVSPCNSLKASVEETEVNVSESSSEDLIRKELSSLDAYFDKLQGKDQVKKEVVKMNVTKSSLALNDASTETALRSELKSLEQYLDKLAQGVPFSPYPYICMQVYIYIHSNVYVCNWICICVKIHLVISASHVCVHLYIFVSISKFI